MKLNDYTVWELYKELCTRDEVLSVQLWLEDDVREVVVDEHVGEFMKRNVKAFGDRCTELGWEVMGDLADFDGVRKEE